MSYAALKRSLAEDLGEAAALMDVNEAKLRRFQ